MIDEVVVVIRTTGGDDILALLHGELDGVVRLESPYYVKFNPVTSNVTMVPYCPLSDERFFEMRRDKLEFCVTANEDISNKFLKMVKVHDDELDDSEWIKSTFVSGTDTKH